MEGKLEAEALNDLTGMQNPSGGHKVSLESALILGGHLEKRIPTSPPSPKISGQRSCRQLKGTVTMQNLQQVLGLLAPTWREWWQ